MPAIRRNPMTVPEAVLHLRRVRASGSRDQVAAFAYLRQATLAMGLTFDQHMELIKWATNDRPDDWGLHLH